MDHETVVQQKMTERYLLDELEPEVRGEFEEHFFDCQACALDVRAAALFVEQSKAVLAQKRDPSAINQPFHPPVPVTGWSAWLGSVFRPAFVVSVMALLLMVIGYQNLVTYPHLQQAVNSLRVLPWAQVNVGTAGSDGPVITTPQGQSFLIFVRIPPDSGYSSYIADLYNPSGKLAWSLTIPVTSAQQTAGQDEWPVQVPAGNHEAGSYKLAVRGVTTAGDSKEVGQASFELQIKK